MWQIRKEVRYQLEDSAKGKEKEASNPGTNHERRTCCLEILGALEIKPSEATTKYAIIDIMLVMVRIDGWIRREVDQYYITNERTSAMRI